MALDLPDSHRGLITQRFTQQGERLAGVSGNPAGGGQGECLAGVSGNPAGGGGVGV